MGNPKSGTIKKADVSLGAWPETRDALFRLCEHYGHKRVQMLYFIVDAFERLSAAYNHDLKLPVVFDDLDTKTVRLPRGVSVKNLSPSTKHRSQRSRGSSAGAGKNQ